MASPAEITLLSLYLVQFPIAIFVYADMCRFNLDKLQRYDLAILVPLGGFLVLPYYILERRGFKKAEYNSSSYLSIIKTGLVSIRTKLFVLTLMTGVTFRAAGSQAPGSTPQLILLIISGIGAFLLFRILRQYQST